jgi:small subunit ribosomal protein S6
MRRYELIFILRPSLGEEQINTVVDYAQKIIGDENGTVVDLNRWGMKKLAYPIKKEFQGYYVFCDFAGTPAAVSEIERRFRIDDAVLKYLTIKIADAITPEEIEAAISETAQRNEAAAEAAKAEEAAQTEESEKPKAEAVKE